MRKIKNTKRLFPSVQSPRSALLITNRMPQNGPVSPLGGAGGGRGRRKRGDSGAGSAKGASDFFFSIFSLDAKSSKRSKGKKTKLFLRFHLATLGPISRSKSRASTPRRAIRRGALDSGDGTRKGAEHDSAGVGGTLRVRKTVSERRCSFSSISFLCRTHPPRDRPPPPRTHRTLALAPWTSKTPRALVTTETIVAKRRFSEKRKERKAVEGGKKKKRLCAECKRAHSPQVFVLTSSLSRERPCALPLFCLSRPSFSLVLPLLLLQPRSLAGQEAKRASLFSAATSDEDEPFFTCPRPRVFLFFSF